MEQSNSSELDKLVSMAEEVSDTVNKIKTQISKLRSMAVVSFFGIYATMGLIYIIIHPSKWIIEQPLFLLIFLILLTLILGVASLFYFFQYIIKHRVYRNKLTAEIQILYRLLDMVHEYKDNIYDTKLSYVEEAILDMKLRRLEFSSKN
ncbi:hypothetical protein [Rheinheimera salexigens]|uniref:DUF4231 domain-containing protein n=1 Tax=Rheinheimera salexigens TaxID=1628148 RepID=A0A1E7Q882_9GAMM|nr:hypothetical protein [Rheinheimera salexigens]OEY70347.1 hypothetical protein BI198_12770 [Rheinheimera salexigens]